MEPIKYNALSGALVLVGTAGAQITCHDQAGEIVWQLGLEPGKHNTDELRNLMQSGDELTIEGQGSLVRQHPGRARRMAHPSATHTGANPDWTPANESVHEKTLRRLVTTVTQQSRTLDKRLKALGQIERKSDVIEREPPKEKAEPEKQAVKAEIETLDNDAV